MSEVVLMDEPDVTGPACCDDITGGWNTCTDLRPKPAYSIELTEGGIAFDGRTFAHLGGPWVDFAANLGLMQLLDLAYRGRRGDQGAAQLLTAFGVAVNDANGDPYWPAEERK